MRMTRTAGRLQLPALLVVLAIVAAACSGTTASNPPTSAPTAVPSTAPSQAPSTAPTAAPTSAPSAGGDGVAVPAGYQIEPGQPGGTFTGAWAGPCCVGVDSIQPLTATGDGLFIDKIWEHLVTYSINPSTGGYGEIIPMLAASWETAPDGLTWTFKLQPNVKWHDGTDFTSADVKFSLEICSDPKTGGCIWAPRIVGIAGTPELVAGTASELSGVTTPDPLTVVIKTTKPDAAFLDNLSAIWMLQKATVEKIPRDGSVSLNPYWVTPGQAIGTGPFKVTGYQAGTFMELSRHDDYWRGRPLLDKIIRKEFKDSASALLAFDKGEVDLAYVTADEVERERSNANARVIAGASGVPNEVVFNQAAHPAFADKRFRQAMQYAIDRQEILDSLYGGQGQLLSCLFGNPDYQATAEKYPYDPEKAKALIQEAGIDLAGLPEFTFTTYYNDPLSLNVMTVIQQYWAEIGFKVKVQQMDSASWVKTKNEGDLEVWFQGSGSGPDGNIASIYFPSSAAYPNGANGWEGFHFNNADVDRLIAEGVQTFDVAERTTIYQELCKVLADELMWNVMWMTTRYWVVNNRIGNFYIATGGGAYYDAAEYWYVKS